MREQLRKEIVKRTGEYVQSAAAAAAYEEESAKITASYDRMVAEGKTELEAYRALLADVETMKNLLASIAPAEEAAEKARQQKQNRLRARRLSKIAGSLNGILWLSTVILYFLTSFAFGNWHLSWLIFLSSSGGSIIIDMVTKYNKGIPLHKMGGWHGLLWLGITMFYFLFSFTTGKWALSWLLFVGGVLAEVIWDAVKKLGGGK